MKSQAALKFFSRKRKTRHIHVSASDSIRFEDRTQNPEFLLRGKPQGLWYGINDSWIDWCHLNMSDWVHEYIYELNLDESRILKIRDIHEFEAFEREYGITDDQFFSQSIRR